MAEVNSNGQSTVTGLLENYQTQVLAANREVTEALVTVGAAYNQALQSVFKLSFASFKTFSSVVASQAQPE